MGAAPGSLIYLVVKTAEEMAAAKAAAAAATAATRPESIGVRGLGPSHPSLCRRADQPLDDFADPGAVLSGGHVTGKRLERIEGVRHCDAASAHQKERLIVLGVADADDVACG